MLPWLHLASANAPDGDTLRLLRRGDEFSIRLQGGNELMSSRLYGSEEALAGLSLKPLAHKAALRVLIGGLGMGFTLRAAQAITPPDSQLVVAEIVPELVGWASEHMPSVFGDCLSDPRVDVLTKDVAHVIREAAPAFDAILLDVDNGPGGLTRTDNDALYSDAGLRSAYKALNNGGVLAVWSAAPDNAFAKRMSQNGFDVSTHSVRASSKRSGARHTIWIGIRAER